MHIDNMLNDICRFATIHAAGALSKFMQVPLVCDEYATTFFISSDWMDASLLCESGVSFYKRISKGITGSAVVLYDKNTAHEFCDILYKRPLHGTKMLGELEVSILSELANVLVGDFLTSLSIILQRDLIIHQVSIYDADIIAHILTRIKDTKNISNEDNLCFIAKIKQNEALIYLLCVFKYSELRAILIKDNR